MIAAIIGLTVVISLIGTSSDVYGDGVESGIASIVIKLQSISDKLDSITINTTLEEVDRFEIYQTGLYSGSLFGCWYYDNLLDEKVSGAYECPSELSNYTMNQVNVHLGLIPPTPAI